MATKKYVVSGEAYWAKCFLENRDMKGFEGAYELTDGAYTIEVKLDKANKAKLKESGSSIKGRFDDDGNFFAKFKRPHNHRFEWAGGPPQVIGPDENERTFSDGIIPNGSKVDVEFSVYTTSKANGTRLEAVYITELAELEERPQKVEEKPSKKAETISEDVPF